MTRFPGLHGRRQAAIAGGALLLFLLAAEPLRAQQPRPSPVEGSHSAALPEAPLDTAQRAVKAGRFAEAEAILHGSLQTDAGSSKAQYLLAYSLFRQGKAKESLEAYTRAAALRRPTADDLRNVGQAYILLEDYPDAETWLKTSLQMDQNSPDTWYNLGRLRYIQNRFAQAVECFNKALALAPQSVKAENNLGLAYEGLNRPEEAERAYRQALAWQDAEPPAAASEQPLLNLAILLLHGTDPAQAQPLLLRAVAIAPRDPRIHEQLGQMYLRQSQFAGAARELRTACELDPGKSNLHFLLGQAYKRLGQEREAAAEFAESARLAQRSPGTNPN